MITKRKVSRKKKAEVRINLPQPQDLTDDRASQPTKLFEGKSSSDAVGLQQKMRAAAKEFYELLMDKMHLSFDPEYYDIPQDRFIFQQLSTCVACTPEAVFYLFEGRWIRLTEENLVSAPKALEDIHKAFKKYGRVSCVLPKLGGALV